MRNLIAEDGGQRQHRQHLSALRDATVGTVRIASAYVTDRGLLIGIKNRKVRLLTSLMKMDIASGATNLETVGALVQAGVECRFFGERPRLHAKVYIFGDASAVVTSANLTGSAFNENIEVGVELRGQEVENLTAWFDKLWGQAKPLSLKHLAVLRQQTSALRQEYVKLKKKAGEKLTLPKQPVPAHAFSDDLRDMFDNAKRFFVCNTDRRHTEFTPTGGYFLEEEMHNRGYAAAWENFKFPGHMEQVEPGDAIFMFAKGVGIIGIGR